MAKAAVSVIFTFPALLLTDIVICVYLKASIVMGVFYAILMLLAHLISMVIGILMDSSSPYVEWDDEYSALRGNLNTFFNMAIMMVFSAVVVGLGILMYELLKLPIGVFYGAIFVILLGVMLRMVTVGKKKIIINMGNL